MWKNRKSSSIDYVIANVIAHELGHYFSGSALNLLPVRIHIYHRDSKKDDVVGCCDFNAIESYSSLDEVASFLRRRLISLCSGVVAQAIFIFDVHDLNSEQGRELLDMLWQEYGLDDLGKFEEYLRLYVAIVCQGPKNLDEWGENMDMNKNSIIFESVELLRHLYSSYKVASDYMIARMHEYPHEMTVTCKGLNDALAKRLNICQSL